MLSVNVMVIGKRLARKNDMGKLPTGCNLLVFQVFDHENNRTVDEREIGTIIRSLGHCPSESQLQVGYCPLVTDKGGRFSC